VGLSYSCGTKTLIGSLKLSIGDRSGKGNIAEGRQNKESRGELHLRLIGNMVLIEIEGLLWNVERRGIPVSLAEYLYLRKQLKDILNSEQRVVSQMGLSLGVESVGCGLVGFVLWGRIAVSIAVA
jgi:hypothetical protein